MSGVIQTRVERLVDDRKRENEKLNDLIASAENEKRDLNEAEEQMAAQYRQKIVNLEEEIDKLATDLERQNASRDVSALLRAEDEGDGGGGESESEKRARVFAQPRSESALGHRDFAEYVRDQLIVDPKFGNDVLSRMNGDPVAIRAQAQERLERTLQNVTSTTVAGLIVPTHMTEIMDIIDRSRPIVAASRSVPLDRGSLTYPKIGTRPTVVQQTSEKTEAGTVAPSVTQESLSALTFLGATNISWQAANWSDPSIIGLYLELAAEAYARQTEQVAAEALETSAIGTVGTASGRLGTAGTESFSQWRTAVVAGLQLIATNTGNRHRTNTLFLSMNRFYQLAALGTDQVAQMSPIGSVDMGAGTGSFFGLNVVGSHGFDQDTAIVGDASALFCGENPGNPVEMRVIEPRIGGWEVGLIGAFNAVCFDVNRFAHLGTHL